MGTHRSLIVLGTLIALSAFAYRPAPAAFAASTLDRPADPVVLTGADVPWFTGVGPGGLVAFRYDGGWQQIPVQVDERAVKDFADIYSYDDPWGLPSVRGITELVYTDSETFTGPDPDVTLDDDDEIAFMAKDAGGLAPTSASEPVGVIPGSGIELTISDPLNPAQVGYVYLFLSDGSLSPDAGQQYVTYNFNLLSGPYLTTYNTHYGPNPEDSVVTTSYYSHHFSDRWISDELQITVGGASGVDILDRHKNLFAPGLCVRSEDTFSNGEGAFIVNKNGPVRALRSYLGANSGPLTQREHAFYERRQDIRTFLRVHEIQSVMDFFDYSPAATGMTYYNDLNTSGVIIDGNPDSVALGAIQWELVSGAQGSLVIDASVSTDIAGLSSTSYYLDDSSPGVTQCTGDEFAYGSSGLYIDQSISCTDPRLGCTQYLRGTRIIYYEAPALTVGEAEALSGEANAPLTYMASPWSDGDDDGVLDAWDNCPAVPNPGQENTDSGPPPSGTGGVGNGMGIPGDDVTVPNGDPFGDVCDDDLDNDGILNGLDSDPGSDITYDDNNDGNPCPPLGTDASDDGPSWDSNCNAIIDGMEGQDCGSPTADTDGDGLMDAWESCKWGTSDVSTDSDVDGLGDCVEAADVDGDGVVDFVDDVVYYAKAALLSPASFGKDGDFDINGDGIVDFVLDVIQEARFALIPGLCQ
jgi:hypothetical protein